MNLFRSYASTTELLLLGGVIYGPRKPHNIQCYNLVAHDELSIAEHYGIHAPSPCGTKAIDITAKLILHSCDGPATGLTNGQQTAGATYGCTLCEICGKTHLGRVLYGRVRRHLPLGHPYRTDPTFGPPELDGPPPPRNVDEVRRQAAAADLRAAAGESAADIGTITKVMHTTLFFTIVHNYIHSSGCCIIMRVGSNGR
jgi:hypothetical protein